jgi:hypothetical protein
MLTKKPVIDRDSFFHRRLQSFVASFLFPPGNGDWFAKKGYGKGKDLNEKTPFDYFHDEQTSNKKARYYEDFKGLSFSQKHVPATLANGKPCKIEVMRCEPTSDFYSGDKPAGHGKHIVYLPGANTYYQACFRDITTAAKETGATVHAFNFPGTGSSTEKVSEANDLINAGIAVVNSLLEQGVSPDDIILQGDCYGAGIAMSVRKEFQSQSGIELRLIMKNAFKSFKSVVFDQVDPRFLSKSLKDLVKKLLIFTGWHVTPGKDYKQSGPYQCHISHEGDQTLLTSSLSKKAQKYRTEMKTGVTTSKKREAMKDECPLEYRESRDKLENMHVMRVKEEALPRLKKKFGVDRHGRANSHFADLCEMETMNGDSVYSSFINEYIKASDAYIAKHPCQVKITTAVLPKALARAQDMEIEREEADELSSLAETLSTSASASLRSEIDDADLAEDLVEVRAGLENRI